MSEKKRPAIKGLTWYREQYFSFFIPMDWTKAEWPDEREGIIFQPKPEDSYTVFAVEVKDLGTTLTSEDLTYLNIGFLDGIKQLPDSHIDEKEEKVTGGLLQLSAKYTFTEEGETRKRWVRVLYQDSRQITMTAQGSTTENYDYWLPIFYEAMMTANVHRTKPETM